MFSVSKKKNILGGIGFEKFHAKEMMDEKQFDDIVEIFRTDDSDFHDWMILFDDKGTPIKKVVFVLNNKIETHIIESVGVESGTL